jgi:hypothetical protein
LKRVKPGPETPLLSYDYIRNLLLSKDLSRLEELKWIDENGGTFRFLDNSASMEGLRTAFVSFPRSGNSFLRRLIEVTTGMVTGSDHKLELILNLQVCGLMGEGHCGEEDNVLIVKSHYPIKHEFHHQFTARKQFVLLRNPLDAIPSHANLINTTSHSLQLKGDYHTQFPDYWKWIVEKESVFIRNFFQKNLDNAQNGVPTYFVRFEDLMTEPQRVLTELFCFIFDVPSIKDTVLEA